MFRDGVKLGHLRTMITCVTYTELNYELIPVNIMENEVTLTESCFIERLLYIVC